MSGEGPGLPASRFSEPPEQPHPRQPPLSLDGPRRDLQDLGGLLHRQAAEEPKLDDAALPRLEGLELMEGLVEGEQVDVHLDRFVEGVAEGDSHQVAPPLRGQAGASMVDEDAAHQRGREAEELGPVLPLDRPGAHQLEVDLIDESRGLEGGARALVGEMAFRHASQVLDDEGHQLLQRRWIPLAPLVEQSGDVSLGWHLGRILSRDAPNREPGARRSGLLGSRASRGLGRRFSWPWSPPLVAFLGAEETWLGRKLGSDGPVWRRRPRL